MSCQSAPADATDLSGLHQCPSLQPISVHQCSLISAH
ncbi:unnamed protein product, partial [Staurois parvus]